MLFRSVDVPKERIGSANGFFTVMTQMSMGMGVAVGAVTLRLAAWMRGGSSSAPTFGDFHVAFALVSLIAAGAVLDCLGLDRDAGVEVSQHTRS